MIVFVYNQNKQKSKASIELWVFCFLVILDETTGIKFLRKPLFIIGIYKNS